MTVLIHDTIVTGCLKAMDSLNACPGGGVHRLSPTGPRGFASSALQCGCTMHHVLKRVPKEHRQPQIGKPIWRPTRQLMQVSTGCLSRLYGLCGPRFEQ